MSSATRAATHDGEPYTFHDGVFLPEFGADHREDEYDSRGFDTLNRMQQAHFWYRGRHRFLLHALRHQLQRHRTDDKPARMVDLGGGCGGWISYLLAQRSMGPCEFALADSSPTALDFARRLLPSQVALYQIDLLQLGWQNRWEVAFLLDVLEHIPQHEKVLREIARSLTPGGLLFVTTPALNCFWTWNDDVARHQRRYSKQDYRTLAHATGLELLDVRYFMFLLSPLLLASRWLTRGRVRDSHGDEAAEIIASMHAVPPAPINSALGALFAMETPLGHWIPFPWGTSILAVFRKPIDE